MDYIQCRHCSARVEAKHYKLHVKYNHKGAAIIFYCSIESCNRPFNSLKCLRNHFASHEIDSQTLVCSAEDKKLNHSVGEILARDSNSRQSRQTKCTSAEVIIESENPSISDVRIDDADSENLRKSSPNECTVTNSIIESKIMNCMGATTNSPLFGEAVAIVSEFYSDTSLSRVQVQRIVNKFNLILNGESMNNLKSQVLGLIDDNAKESIAEQFDQLQSMFRSLDTEHKRLKELGLKWHYIEPQEFVLQYVEEKNREGLLDIVKVTGQFIPLGRVLAAFFRVPNVLDETLNYARSLQSRNDGVISNIIQTEFWKRKARNCALEPNSIVLPLLVYEDDFETGNPLGSRAGIHKLSGLYASIPCLPPQFNSKLNNIFLFQLVHADDAKITPKDRLYAKAIEELNVLALKGIEINIHGKVFTIYFKLALIVGDNLGLNSILGYTQSFSANYYCRECTASKHQARSMCVEDKTLLRTVADYESALAKGDVGIKTKCAWNKVKDYHVAENSVADLMHDRLEGGCRYEVFESLYNWIVVQKLFTVETLNDRLKYFKYPSDSNPPGLITLENIKSRNIRMSASEMKCFILNAGLILGDLIPEGNLEWELYKLSRQILSLLLETSCTPDLCDLLATLVKEHLELYIELFGNGLKPKHHFMTHYPRIMRTVGPLRHLWAMRFEGKHRTFKNAAVVTRNRVNICKTLALKNQLNLNDMLLNGDIFESITTCGNAMEETSIPVKALSCLPEDFIEYQCIEHLTLENVKYQPGMTVTIGHDEFPLFGLIKLIFCRKSNRRQLTRADFAIAVKVVETKGVNEHLQAYEVEKTNRYRFLEMQSLTDYKLNYINFSADGGYYICL